jgi:glucose-1-phosphate adenylyltransferase
MLSPGVRVHSYSEVESSILTTNCQIGRHSRVRRAIIPPGVELPEFTVIGHDLEQDRAKGYTVSESGVVVVPPPGTDLARSSRTMSA